VESAATQQLLIDAASLDGTMILKSQYPGATQGRTFACSNSALAEENALFASGVPARSTAAPIIDFWPLCA